MVFAVVIALAACNNNPKTTEPNKDMGVSDSTLYKNNALADTAQYIAPVMPPPTKSKTTHTDVNKQSPNIEKHTKTTSGTVAAPAPVGKDTSTSANKTNAGNAGSGTESTTSAPTTVPEKKGWSNAAKGATIGGVGGAIGGAIISKKKGKGAVIGGAIGAAGGYILGRKKDKANKDTIK